MYVVGKYFAAGSRQIAIIRSAPGPEEEVLSKKTSRWAECLTFPEPVMETSLISNTWEAAALISNLTPLVSIFTPPL